MRPANRRPLLARLLVGAWAASLTGCARDTGAPPAAPAAAAPPGASVPAPAPATAPAATIAVNALLNSGFEWIADHTTEPPKYGAYWFGAFEPKEGSPACLVVDDQPFRGERCLRLSSAGPEVVQKIATDPRSTDRLVVTLALRAQGAGELRVVLEDGPGRRTRLTITAAEDGSAAVRDAQGRPVTPLAALDAGDGWRRLALDLGAAFAAEHGERALPRLNLRLSAGGPAGARVDVDEVVAATRWPALTPGDLRRSIEELVRGTLQTWYLPESEGGRGLVDASSGYVSTAGCDVETGGAGAPERSLGFHTVHKLLTKWLRESARLGRSEESARWRPWLQRLMRSLLEHNFDPDSGLPRTVAAGSLQPEDGKPIAVHVYVDALLDAHELLAAGELADACLAQARRVADRLVALRIEHELPDDPARRLPVWSPRIGRFEGDVSDWHGFLPDKLTPKGGIETDRLYYTSWAILTGRSFWYEMLRSPAAIVRVWTQAPRDGDLDAVRRIAGRFHRDWDAARYDLENDTDDHYGYLAEDGLEIAALAGAELPEVLALVQEATDHRLQRSAARADDTLWIQAVRLGTACAGDSPRAFVGPLGLHDLPATLNPASSGLPLYRDALLELAANDFKGRQLTNAQFTESFFKHWEMVCICYKGTYQGDCREQPPEYWDGDVGDTFGGPPASAIDAQAAAWRVAGPAERPVILGRLAIIRDVTDATMRRRWGYVFGLDTNVARQYGLPEKYVIGLSTRTAGGLGYAMAWMRLLPDLEDAAWPQAPGVAFDPAGGALLVSAPAGSVVALPCQALPFPAPVSDRDPRMLALDLAAMPGGLAGATRVTTGADGTARLPLEALGAPRGSVQPLCLDADSGVIISIGEPLALP